MLLSSTILPALISAVLPIMVLTGYGQPSLCLPVVLLFPLFFRIPSPGPSVFFTTSLLSHFWSCLSPTLLVLLILVGPQSKLSLITSLWRIKPLTLDLDKSFTWDLLVGSWLSLWLDQLLYSIFAWLVQPLLYNCDSVDDCSWSSYWFCC